MFKSILRSLGLATFRDYMTKVDDLVRAVGERDLYFTRAKNLGAVIDTHVKEKQALARELLAESTDHKSTLESLRVSDLRNQGLADERTALENQINVLNSRVATASALLKTLPIISSVEVIPSDAMNVGKITRYAICFRVRIGDDETDITTRSLVASARNKKELKEDVAAIKAQLKL